MPKNPSNHGGRRPNAGRPSLDKREIKLTLRSDNRDHAKATGNASEYIDHLIDRDRGVRSASDRPATPDASPT